MKPSSPQKPEPHYHAYLLKVWRARGHETVLDQAWYFSLEDAQTGVRRGFPDLDSLQVYLQDLTRPHPGKIE